MSERGLPHPHNQDVEKKYCEYKLDLCRKRKDEWIEELLLEHFKEDFEDFTLEMLKNFPRVLRRDLRQHLTKYRVYVSIGVGINITTALHDVLTNKLNDPPARSNLLRNVHFYTAESVQKPHHDAISQIKQQIVVLADNISQLSSNEKFNTSLMVNVGDGTNNTLTQHNAGATTTSYSSIGAIPNLIKTRSYSSTVPLNCLIGAFPHPSSKFNGPGSVLENLGTYHHQFMNVLKTFNLTERKALVNL